MYGHHFFSYTQKVWNNYLKCWAWWVNRVETICPLWRSTDLPILIANAEAKKNLECIIQWRGFLVYVRGLVEGSSYGETKKAAASVTYGVFKPQWTNLFNLSYWWHQRRRAEKWLDIGTTPFSSCFKKKYYNIFKTQNMFIWKQYVLPWVCFLFPLRFFFFCSNKVSKNWRLKKINSSSSVVFQANQST